jgi:hypothetical protein
MFVASVGCRCMPDCGHWITQANRYDTPSKSRQALAGVGVAPFPLTHRETPCSLPPLPWICSSVVKLLPVSGGPKPPRITRHPPPYSRHPDRVKNFLGETRNPGPFVEPGSRSGGIMCVLRAVKRSPGGLA